MVAGLSDGAFLWAENHQDPCGVCYRDRFYRHRSANHFWNWNNGAPRFEHRIYLNTQIHLPFLPPLPIQSELPEYFAHLCHIPGPYLVRQKQDVPTSETGAGEVRNQFVKTEAILKKARLKSVLAPHNLD
jgi:hypothetical protein